MSLTKLYAELNIEFWGGKLPSPHSSGRLGSGPPAERGVVVRRVGIRLFSGGLRLRGSNLRASGRFTPPGQYWPARIAIVSGLPKRVERQVLLHEMIHCHLHFAGAKEADAHGPLFVAELERLASLGESWAAQDARRQADAEEEGRGRP